MAIRSRSRGVVKPEQLMVAVLRSGNVRVMVGCLRGMEFNVVARQGRARCAVMKLPHFTCETPMFMPVGTRGTVKGLTSQQLQDLDCQVVLGNTYHLETKPGSSRVQQLGGFHQFMNWPRGILTDSGGFQMVSLLKLAEIREEGVEFQSPVNGKRMLLTPEESIRIQNRLGADIIMALDDVVPADSQNPERFLEATHRTTRWLDRCLKAHQRPDDQNLFAIVQGGTDLGLREISLKELVSRSCPGYAIGGLVGGEEKDAFWRTIRFCADRLPYEKPRYVMGVGYPIDIVICSALGTDMYDSVYPTRTARFGNALTSRGVIKLNHNQYASDLSSLDPACACSVCQTYTRASLRSLLLNDTMIGCRLVTIHNVSYMMQLTKEMREAIKAQRFPEFVRGFFDDQFQNPDDIPLWAVDALESVGIRLGKRGC